MRNKGFTLTLMAVATAMLGAQAQAMAPTISDIPSPIVGSAEDVTGGGTLGKFVYLDAIDLNLFATDDVTAPSNLMWTYTGTGTNGASNYQINGVNPINLLTTDPTSPTTAMIINRNDDPVPGKDAFKNTITIRNKVLSPLPMGSAGTAAGANDANNVVPAQTQIVTFFCSDGNAFTSESVFFYTDNGGNDRLSGGDPFKVEKTDKITTMWNQGSEWMGGVTRVRPSTSTTNGVCLNVDLTGNNVGTVVTSPYPYFNLAANSVYRFKMKMSTSNTVLANVPFWDMIIENYDATGKGYNMYSMDTLVFANQGNANSLTPTVSTFTWYWTPPAVTTAQWSGSFVGTNDANNDPCMRLRVMDYDMVPAIIANQKSGAVCLHEIEVSVAGVNRAQAVGSPLVNITSLAPNTGSGGNVEYYPVVPTGMSTATFASGAVTLTPSTAAQGVEYAEIRPATDTTFTTDPNDATSAGNFPIVWKSGKILRMQVGLSAPTAADETNPYDGYVLGFNTMTNEINADSIQTTSRGHGAPKVGTPQTYTSFFYTGNVTAASNAGYQKLRWLFRALNSDQADFPTGQKLNTGSVRMHSVKVEEVIFK